MKINTDEKKPQGNELNDLSNETVKSKEEINKSEHDKTKAEETVDLESILEELKIHGRYHVRFMVLIGLLVFTSGWHSTNYIFVAENVGYT